MRFFTSCASQRVFQNKLIIILDPPDPPTPPPPTHVALRGLEPGDGAGLVGTKVNIQFLIISDRRT